MGFQSQSMRRIVFNKVLFSYFSFFFSNLAILMDLESFSFIVVDLFLFLFSFQLDDRVG